MVRIRRGLGLFRYGAATKTDVRRSVAGRPHNVATRWATKNALKLSAVKFTGVQARAVAIGIADYARRSELAIWACSVLPDHVHLVIARHRLPVEKLVIQLKGAATQKLLADGLHPFQDEKRADGRPEKCFARGEWKVFLDSPADVLRAIKYVERNPEKEGLPRQRWSFVTPYDQR